MGPKKQKQTMSYGAFMADQSLGPSWADEMEGTPLPSAEPRPSFGGSSHGFSSSSGFGNQTGFTGNNYAKRDPQELPKQPPYTAHLGNLSYDATEENIRGFLQNCVVTSVRLVEDKFDRRPKGFGYVEFATVDDLKKAIDLDKESLSGRAVSISIADPPKDRAAPRHIDWTRGGPLSDGPSRRISTGGQREFGGGFDLASEGRSSSRRGGAPGDGDRALNAPQWERKGPLAPSPGAPQGAPRERPQARGERSFERRASPSWGEGMSREGSRPPRPVPERTPTLAEKDTQWRARMRPDPPTPTLQTPDASMPSSPAAPAPPALAVRPKLNLAKRSVSNAPDETPTSATDSKASPFGAARPIDTATREAEIEKKRDEARAAKEAEDKAKAEKAAAEGPQQRKASNRNSMPPPPARAGSEQNGAGRGGRSARNGQNVAPVGDGEQAEPGQGEASRFALLNPDDEGEGADGAVDAPANGNIVDDKAVKPKEIVRQPGQAPAADTAEALQGDGWSTVTAPKGKGHRRGFSQAQGRPLAS